MKRFPHCFPLLLVPALVVLAYGHTLSYPFHFDDQKLIELNPAIRNLTDPLRAIISVDPGHKNRPLLMLSLALNCQFGGYHVFGFHLLNLLILCFCSITVYAISLRLGRLYRRGKFRSPAFRGAIVWAALFFAVQPMNTEAITYISGRSSSMSAFFMLMALLFFLNSRQLEEIGDASAKWRSLGLCALFYALSIASKEIGIVLPALLVAIDYYCIFLSGKKIGPWGYIKGRWAAFLPFVPVILLFFAYRFMAQGGALIEGRGGWFELYSGTSYTFTEINVVPFYYLNKLFLPINQNIDIYHDVITSFFNLSTLMGAGLILGLCVMAFVRRISSPWLFLAVFWFFVTLAPTSSFVPILDVAVERRLFLPGVAIVFLSIHFLSPYTRKTIAPLILLLILFSTNTISRNFVYRDHVTLWADSASKSIREPRPHYNYAQSLKKAGRPDQAVVEYQKTLALPESPYNHQVHNHLGLIYMKKGLFEKAAKEFIRCAELKPQDPMPRNNLGTAYLRMGELDKARAEFLAVLSIDPEDPEAGNNLGVIYVREGFYDKAYLEFKRALKKDPLNNEVKMNLDRLKGLINKETKDR